MMSKNLPTIVIASDHAGYLYKEKIKHYLADHGYTVADYGTSSEEPVDYPDFMKPAAEAVANAKFDLGIILGGSGNGEAITANKVSGIRCAVCWNVESARLAKAHNNANMISLGQRMVEADTALKIVETWLNTSFEGGRHLRRITKIETS